MGGTRWVFQGIDRHRRRLVLRQFGRQPSAVVELEAAPTAVKQPAMACDPLQYIEESRVKPVDPVRGLQADHAMSAANGAAHRQAHMESEPARDKLLPFAFPALVNGHIAEPFDKGSMDTVQLTTALAALRGHDCL